MAATEVSAVPDASRTVPSRMAGRGDFAARFLVRAAITAPSVHNTQPWRFVARHERLELFADLSRPLRVGDPAGREMVISCGAALFNVRLAIRHLGFVPRVRLLPDPGRPDLLADIQWGVFARPASVEETLYRAMWRRHTHRGPFDPVPVPPWLIGPLCDVARRERAMLYPIRDAGELRRLAEVVRIAELAQRADERFVAERIRWVAPPEVGRPDGLPALAYPRQPDGLAFASRDFAVGAPWGFRLRPHRPDLRRDRPLVGTVAVLCTPSDRKLDWLLAGQALQHVLLYAAAHGVKVAFHTQPLELPDLRADIRAELFGRNAHPQMIVRLGYTARVLITPRRTVSDVLAEEPWS